MILRRPFPLDTPSRHTFRYTFYAALCVFLILVLLQPFGLDELPFLTRSFHAALYGLVTFISTTVNSFLLPGLFPAVYREEKWTVGKELLHMCWHLVPITIGNWLLTHWLYGVPLSLHTLFTFLWITFVVGIFPLWLNVLLKQQRLLKKYQAGATRLDEQLHQPQSISQETTHLPAAIVFESENGKEQFTVAAADIRYITSADNYMRIYFLQENKLASHLLRNTLRKAEGVLSPFPQFFRCHRAYIVNLAVAEHVSGNAQGYKLHLKDVAEVIPVSRNFNAKLTEVLTQQQSVK
ncbi:LytTR family transcriptional regulator [Niastella caeni]|uniref:LytTR family transcriptional regulator n=1 Tax=Niastella caeni TaxID=2569763 RepID=A0A4S8HZ69_9BACT|nr:LytTR family DNA-binding domain-containing protein [Niastella caeni]THU40671.1 LytTR family transcriptional regulator [Niastella caeni]